MDSTTQAPSGGLFRRLTILTAGLARPLAGNRWFPLWSVLRYVGRRSGKPYQTTIVALPTGDGYLIPLPFGDDTQWVKNVMAAPQAGLRHAGRDLVIDRPEVVELDRIRAELPAPIRFMSGLLGLHDFVRVRKATG